jgi:L-threonylcarbamoyladenylate synthase
MIFPPSDGSCTKAAEILRSGGLVAFPTETVYGLGADATSDSAVACIFEAKQRPSFNPLIVHVASAETAVEIGDFDDTSRGLAEKFWPGPVSLVVPRSADCPISLLASAGLETVAIRVPTHPIAQILLSKTGLPVAAPSANASGRISPTTAVHVETSLEKRIDMILDGGPCTVGLESTVIDCTADKPVILRPGGLAKEEIEAVTGPLPVLAATDGAPASPGMLESHYAPDAELRLGVSSVPSRHSLLSFGKHAYSGFVAERNLSPAGDLVEAAANLFAMMRELDEIGAPIAVTPIPEHGLGLAINDRLRRAAAPRPST